MHNEATARTLPATWTIDQIGSFKLGLPAHHQIRTALTIAKLMRRGGDGEVEDAARAIRLMLGAALFDRGPDEFSVWDEFEAEDEVDHNEQIVAYMDGTAELARVLREGHIVLHSCGTEGGC